MAHYTKNNERKFTKENKSRLEYIMCFECEAQGSQFCVTLKMCLVVAANEDPKGQRLN